MGLEFLAEGDSIFLLDANPGLVIWTFLIFGIVLFILWRFAWAPIAKALDERANKIHSDISKAESLREEAEAKLKDYLEKLDGLKAEGQEIVSEARKDAEQLKNDMLAQARKESEDMKNRSLRELKLAKDSALEEIHQQVTELSVAVASRILERDLKADDHKKLVEETLSSLKSMN